MLGHAEFEPFAKVDCGSPRVLNSYRVRGPGVERLGNGLAKQEGGSAPQHETPEGRPTEGTNLQNSGQHVARKHAAGCIHAAVIACVACTNIGVDFIVWGGQIKLSPSPEH